MRGLCVLWFWVVFFIGKLLLSPALRWLLVPLLPLCSCSVYPQGGPGLQNALRKHQIQRTDAFPPTYVEEEKELFSELLAHVTWSNFAICAMRIAQPSPRGCSRGKALQAVSWKALCNARAAFHPPFGALKCCSFPHALTHLILRDPQFKRDRGSGVSGLCTQPSTELLQP